MNTGRQKQINLMLLFLPLLLAIPVGISLLEKPFAVYPSPAHYELGPLLDNFANGTSVVHTISAEGAIRCEYTLGFGAYLPEAGFYFRLSTDLAGLDLSRYTEIRIEIKSSLAQSVRIYLKSLIPGYTNLNQDSTFYPLEYELTLDQNRTTYTIPVKAFNSLPWWFTKNPKFTGRQEMHALKNLYNFQVYSGKIPLQMRDTLVVKSITFHKSYAALYTGAGTGIGIYYLALLILRITKRLLTRKGSTRDVLPSLAGSIGIPGVTEIDKIIASFKAHFTDPDFSIWQVKEDTGYQNRKISRLLKDNYAQSFAQVLNIMRITAAREQLEKTELTATEIAFNVGYNNYTHFLREFKKQTGIAAQKYRTGKRDVI